MNIFKKVLAIALTLALIVGAFPLGEVYVSAQETENINNENNTQNNGENQGEEKQNSEMDSQITEVADHQKEIIDEANALGVPNAFIRHIFADEYNEDKLEDPHTELEMDEEEPEYKLKVVNAKGGNEGLQIKGLDTGIMARTLFDLGEFDFGELKVGNMIYNMLAKRNLKGKAYFYFADNDQPFATATIKRCADDDWEATQNKAVDVRGKNLTGSGHIYLKFVADSALNDDESIKPVSNVKGNLYFESMFFTEGSTPVVDFDLDNEVNSIEKINGSEKHTITGYGNMNVKIPDNYKSEYTDDELQDQTYELEYIRGRGNSTWLVDKKPYKIKLEKKANLFGMGTSKHWVLLANYYDYSLLRNKFTFQLGKEMGMEYTPKSVSVDVIISGEYYGSYQLSQQIRIEKDSVNIDDLEDKQETSLPKISGGYLLSLGGSWLTSEDEDLNQYFDSVLGTFKIEKPEYDSDYSEEAKTAQKKYLVKYFNELGVALRSADKDYVFEEDENDEYNLTPLEDGKTWRDYMDEESFIDYYLFQEFSKNADAYSPGSTYMYKKRNGKLYWGPLWDFDFVAWGASETNYTADGALEEFSIIKNCPWFSYLFTYDEEFKNKVIERWNVFSEILKDAVKDGGYLDKEKEKLYYSALANYQVRGSYLMQETSYWEEPMKLIDDQGNPYTLNYGNEIERLKNYVKLGVAWMDENISNIDKFEKDEVQSIKIYVDDEVYKEVYADYNGLVSLEEIGDAPKKEGKIFKGWFFINEEGNECKVDDNTYLFYYDYEETKMKPYRIYAKYIDEADYKKIESVSFSRDTLYVPMYLDDLSDGNESESNIYYNHFIKLDRFVNLKPFEADPSELTWTYTVDENDTTNACINNPNELQVYNLGEGILSCTAGNASAQIKVVAFDASSNPEKQPEKWNIKENISLDIGQYGDLDFEFEDADYVSYEKYDNISFKSSNEAVVKVNNNGIVYATGSGTANIYVVRKEDGIFDFKVCKVTVANKNTNTDNKKEETVRDKKDNKSKSIKKPGKVVIKKVYDKKLKSQKLKLKLNAVKNAKGYEVRIYSKKDNAKKNRKYLLKKIIKKKNATISSKKLKNIKNLYVKVRAYNKKGKIKKYGKWSKIAVVKIK